MTLVLKSTVVVSASEFVRVPVRLQMLLLSQPVNLGLVTDAIGNKDNSGLVPKAVALAASVFTMSALVRPPSRNFSSKRLGKALELRPVLLAKSARALLILVENWVTATSRSIPLLPPPQALSVSTVLKMREDEKTRLLIMLGMLREGFRVRFGRSIFCKLGPILLASYEAFVTDIKANQITTLK